MVDSILNGNDAKHCGDDPVRTSLLADLTETEDAFSIMNGTKQIQSVLSNLEASRLADNGFALVGVATGVDGSGRTKFGEPKLERGGAKPIEQPLQKDAAGKQEDNIPKMVLDEEGRIAEIKREGITTSYDYKEDGSIETRKSVDGKPIDTPKKYPNAKLDSEGTFTWNEGKNSYLERIDGSKQVRTLKDGKILETTDKRGIVTKYSHSDDGTLEARQYVDEKPIGEVKKYPNGNIDERGTLTWHDEEHSHRERLDGYREERNIKTGTGKIYFPGGAWAEERRDKIGIHTTTFSDRVKNIKIAEKTEFVLPQTLQLEMPSGAKEFKGVKSIATFYDAKTGKAIAQSLVFEPPGFAGKEKAFGGNLEFNSSQLDIFSSADGKAEEAIYSSQNITYRDSKGIAKEVSAERIHLTKDDKGVEMLGLSSGNNVNPFVRTCINNGERKESDEQTTVKQNDEIQSLIEELKLGYDARTTAQKKLIEMGPEVLPYLRQALESKDLETRSLAAGAMKQISAKEARKPIPESFLSRMHEFDADLYRVRLAASDDKPLSNHTREDFEKLIVRADGHTIAGLDKGEAQARLALLQAKRKHENGQVFELNTDWAAKLPLSSDDTALGLFQASDYLKNGSNRQLQTEENLIADAAHSSGRVRAAYALALSQTGNKADKQKAINILTDAVRKDPTYVPSAEVEENEGPVGAVMQSIYSHDFLKAIVASGALENKEFLNAFYKHVKDAQLTLELINDQLN